VIDGERAAVLYDGLDAGGMVYRPFSDNVVLGLTTEPGKHAMETWVIQERWHRPYDQNNLWLWWAGFIQGDIGKVTGNCLK
jgi:1,6-anhydro-N-acetylmuramate kinase